MKVVVNNEGTLALGHLNSVDCIYQLYEVGLRERELVDEYLKDYGEFVTPLFGQALKMMHKRRYDPVKCIF